MFNSISSWIMSIAGVICMSVIIELVLPEGSINKYIRSIFSFVIVLVIIAPLPSLIGKKFDYSSLDSPNYSLQEDYIYQNNIYKTEAIQKTITMQVEEQGYQGVVVSVSSENFSTFYKINEIFVDVKNLVITDKAKHKNIIDVEADILEIVLRQANIGKEDVHFER